MARKLDQIIVVDIESTCWEHNPPAGQVSDIIEIGICAIDLAKLERLDKRSILVRPEQSEISEFCTQLTTLTLDMFSTAGNLQNAVSILIQTYDSCDRMWASWGDYDRNQFEKCCRRAKCPYPFNRTHLNVKNLFAMYMNLPKEIGLDAAMRLLGREMEGTHHRGDDDAWNIAKVLCEMLKLMRQ